MDNSKKFCTIDDGYFVTHINIDLIKEWRVNYEGELRISLVNGVEYEIPRHTNVEGYDTLLKALRERTV